jgi:hypothetical protein
MKQLFTAIVVATIVAGCASSASKENEFYIGGRKVVLPASEMDRLRGAWSTSVPYAGFNTALTSSEAQWAADFIALVEVLRDRASPCRRLALESIAPSAPDVADPNGRHIPASRFDETWTVTACGVKRAFRAYHPQYSLALAMEEVGR